MGQGGERASESCAYRRRRRRRRRRTGATGIHASRGRSRPGRARLPPVTSPAGGGVRIGAKGVVTGAKCGLRASRGKDRDKNFSREALVTGWYGAATTELPSAAWSAEADVGAERRNQVPLSRPIAMSRGQTPRPRHDGPLLTGGGLAQPKRRGGCRVDSCGHAATGEPPGIDEASEPWRVALQAGPGTFPGRADESQRWQARRAETVLAATVGPPTRRSRRLGRQRKASQGTLAALAAAPPVSHSEGRIAHQHSATPRPPRGRMTRPRGAVDQASRPREPETRAGAASAPRLDAVSDPGPAASPSTRRPPSRSRRRPTSTSRCRSPFPLPAKQRRRRPARTAATHAAPARRSRAPWWPLPRLRRREPGGGAIGQATYAAQSFISTRRRSNRSLRR